MTLVNLVSLELNVISDLTMGRTYRGRKNRDSLYIQASKLLNNFDFQSHSGGDHTANKEIQA